MERENKASSIRERNIYVLGLGIRLILPVLIFFKGLFGGDKDRLSRVYISVNNMVVKYSLHKKALKKVLILLPHCMQNKECSRAISEDIRNCRRCGCCKVGEIAQIAEGSGIDIVVAKGGTVARDSVKKCRPEIILAVACERELVSGICDVGGIPVIGVINQRPKGYCTDTTVDMTELKKALQELTCRENRIHSPEYEVPVKNPIA